MKEELPADYDVYFFSDGKKRPNPFANPNDENDPLTGHEIDFCIWYEDQHNIWLKVMTVDERAKYEAWKESIQGIGERMLS